MKETVVARGPLWLLLGSVVACSGDTPDGLATEQFTEALTTETTADSGSSSTKPVQTLLPGASIPKYVDALPVFTGARVSSASITVDMVEFQQKILPNSIYRALPAQYRLGTTLWGYNVNGTGARFPATTIEARQNRTTVVTYTNHLETSAGGPVILQNYLIPDGTIHWADPLNQSSTNGCYSGAPLPAACSNMYRGPVPAVVHLHGAEVESAYDGNPLSWFTPDSEQRGAAYTTNVYRYPNTQQATSLWYHDHALGLTRINVYAGLAGMYLIRDTRDTGLASNAIGLPAGAYENELAIADRQFDVNGQLFFPSGAAGDPDGLNGPPPNPSLHPYWNPEFFGDVITVNGKSWPYMRVEPRRYRFRMLNASNARFYSMHLDDGPARGPAPAIWQIGSDGGLLNAPYKLADSTDPSTSPLLLAPGERADVIIDFSSSAGKTLTLLNDAYGPFPSGDAPDPDTAGQIMQFRVTAPLAGTDRSFNPARSTSALRASPIVDIKPTAVRHADNVRQLVLVEVSADGGPEEVLLNNSHWNGKRPGTTTDIPSSTPTGFGVSATEAPRIGTTEIWEIANLTEDAHPIHIHLVDFQVIDSQPMALQTPDGDTTYRADWEATFPGGRFGGVTYASGVFIPGYGPPQDPTTVNSMGAVGGNLAFSASYFAGAPVPPAAGNAGWKDTVIMLPKQVTRVAVRWAPQGVGVSNPGVNQFSFDPTTGPGYVWHCHILDHEDNEMMRPMLISR